MKSIFITGVNKGLGRQLFDQLSAKGYRIYGLVRSRLSYEEMLEVCPANSTLIHSDISEETCIEKIRSVVAEASIELVINNAGIGAEGMNLDSAATTEVMELFNIHCVGVLRVVQALKANLLRSKGAVVLNMNSRFGSITYQHDRVFHGMEISYAYRIAKAAQNMLTNCLNIELGDRIAFVSTTPGRLVTNMAQKDANLSPEEGARRIIEHWEAGLFKAENGILQVQGDITPW
jgi:NAD(P)-dependent dehydrogenase (short-subunit alcohol dehydrogenase family)